MQRLSVFVFIMFLSCLAAKAQSTRDPGVKPQAPVYQAEPKKKTGKRKTPTGRVSGVETQAEFQARMKAVAKEMAKRDRMMSKPQYSDPSYFGHKRPPKKRPVGKRKFCKECEMVH
jgi:hypothetical protein